MIAANHGTVVTVASVAGYVTAPGMVDYCSSKAAAVSFHDGLTAELRDRYNAPAVRTVCVCPNYTATTLFKGFHNDSRFLAPTLAPETVAEAVFAKVLAGTSGFVVLPQTGEWMIMTIRAAPYWWQGVISRRIKKAMSGVEKQEVERARALEKEREATKAVGKEEARLGADRAD
jgi:short-subunit dehydrogenase